MRVLRVLFLAAVLASLVFVSGCACGTEQGCQPEAFGELDVCVTTTMPLTYFYGCEAILEVWGPDGFYETRNVLLYMGNQMIIFRNVPIGRYVATLSYSGMVVTKAAIVCGNDEAAVRAMCMNDLKKQLQFAKSGKDIWEPRGHDEFLNCGSSGNGCNAQPFCCDICFTMPDDVMIYDP